MTNDDLRRPYPLINIEKRFILFTNPKCGGTTLKNWFLDSLNFEYTFKNTFKALKYYGFKFVYKWYKYRLFYHKIGKIRSTNAILRKFIKIYRSTTLNEIIKYRHDSNFTKIMVIRNPYDRLVSGFIDKFCGADLNTSWVQEVIKEFGSLDDSGNLKISFTEFVDYLMSHDLSQVNAHWRHQSFISEGVALDRIIDLKELSREMPKLSEELGFTSRININKKRQSNNYGTQDNAAKLTSVFNMSNTDLITFKANNGVFPLKDSFYNEDIRKKVFSIYQADFEAFNF